MARKADETLTVKVEARNLHSADTIVQNDGTLARVTHTYTDRKAGRTTLTWQPYAGGDTATHVVLADRLITVRVEMTCHKCDGRGHFRGGGVIENGVYKGYEGDCFACQSKGWQDRTDTIRDSTYWNKYARI